MDISGLLQPFIIIYKEFMFIARSNVWKPLILMPKLRMLEVYKTMFNRVNT